MKATIKYILVLLVLVATTFTACTKEDNSVVSEKKEVTLTTTLAPAPGISTKTIMNETSDGTISTSWEVGDFIWVKYKNTSNEDVEAQATVTAVDGSGNATISVTMTDPKDATTITFGFPYNYWNDDKDLKTGQIGTLDNIKDNYAASSGTGTLTVSGGVATLPTGVTMTPSVCIWKFSLKDGATDITSSVTTLSVFLGTDSGSEKYVVKPSSLSDIYVALNGSSTPKFVSIAALTDDKAYMKEKSNVTLASGKLYRSENLEMDEVKAFSVSDTKRVVFSSGNLQATTTDYGANWAWNFAAHQYSYVGAEVANNCVDGNGHVSNNGTVDLFGFSTVNTFFGISSTINKSKYSGDFVDWGNNNIGGRGVNYWSTLSEEEWQFVVGEYTCRTNGGTVTDETSTTYDNVLCTKVNLNLGGGNYVKGVILFPDNYVDASGISWKANFIGNAMSKSGTDGWGTEISLANWSVLESAGCVFLPAAGLRVGDYGVYFIDGGISGDTSGFYMSSNSVEHPDDISTLRLNNDGFDPNQAVNRGYAGSVRLVHVLN